MKDEIDFLFESLASVSSETQIDEKLARIEGERPTIGRKLRQRVDGWRALRALAEQVRARDGDADVERLLRPAGGRDLTAQLLDELSGDCAPETLLTPGCLIARGGMSEVVEVWDSAVQRTLAMKVFAFDSATVDPMRLRRFIDEARITGALDHPSIVPVHHFGRSSDGRLFFTMRRVDGITLAEVFAALRRGDANWNLTRVVRVLQQVCDAVGYAHARDPAVIHRDLKPLNVMVGRFGEVYVLDWGIARYAGEAEIGPRTVEPSPGAGLRSELHTIEGTAIGTPNYMSPEQARGTTEAPSARADVYSLGAILYVMLAGHAPYSTGESRPSDVTIALVLAAPPAAVLSLQPRANPELVSICEKAMARDPLARYANAGELASDLRAWLEGRVVAAHSNGALAELRKWIGRNRTVAVVSASSFAALLVGSIAYSVQTKQANADLIRSRMRAESGEALANLVAAAGEFRDGHVAEARRKLDASRTLAGTWPWRHLNARADSSQKILFDAHSPITGLALDPTLSSAAIGCANGKVVVVSLPDGSVRSRFQVQSGDALRVAWLRHSDRIVVGRTDGALELRTVSGELLDLFSGDGSATAGVPMQCMAVSSDDELILVGQALPMGSKYDRPHYTFFTIEGNRILRNESIETDRANSCAFLPGSHLAAIEIQRVTYDPALPSIGIYDPAAHKVVRSLAVHKERVFAVAIQENLGSIATCSRDETIARWDFDQTGVAWKVPHKGEFTPESSGLTLAFSPDSELLASGGWDKSLHLWRTDVAAERHWQQRWGHLDRITQVAFLDSERVLTASLDGTMRMWGLLDSGGLRRIKHPNWVTGMAFSPSGERIATANRDELVRIIDVRSGSTITSLRGLDGPTWNVAWSSNDRWLAAGERTYPLDVHGDPKILVWDLKSEDCRVLRGHEDHVLDVDFDPSDRHLVSSSMDGTLRIWSTETWACERVLTALAPGRFSHVEYSPDGSQLLSSSSNGTVRIWDARTGECELVWGGHSYPVRGARWSPDGRRVASCAAEADNSVNTEVFIWDAATGKMEFELRGHELGVLALAWSPDGKILATGSEDQSIRIWDTSTGECVLTLRDPTGWIGSLEWSSDGTVLASGSSDDILRLWEAPVHKDAR